MNYERKVKRNRKLENSERKCSKRQQHKWTMKKIEKAGNRKQ